MTDTNPYAPPRAVVADLELAGRLKHRSVLVMIGLTIVTLGIYYPVWFFRRRSALNQLDSPKKLQLWPLITFSAVFAVEMIVSVAAEPLTLEEAFGLLPVVVLTLARYATGILMIVQGFRVKDMLEDHLTPPTDGSVPMLFNERVQLSGLATFFLSIYDLQYSINKHLEALQRRASDTPT
jgi:hypothetical protein